MLGVTLCEELKCSWAPYSEEEPRPVSRLCTPPVVAAMAFIVLLLRRHDWVLRPQLWAEDGAVFLREQLTLGASAFIEPYAGYLHFVPRLIAALLGPLPIRWIPLGYTLVATAVAAVCCAWVTRAEHRRWLASDPVRAMLALWIAACPVGREVVGNLANLQWYLLWLGLLLVAGPGPRTRAGWAGWTAALVAIGGTAPGAVALAPLLGVRAALRGGTERQLALLAALPAVALAAMGWWTLGRNVAPISPEVSLGTGAARLVARVALEPFVGEGDPFSVMRRLRDLAPFSCFAMVAGASVVAWRRGGAPTRAWLTNGLAFVAAYLVALVLGRPQVLEQAARSLLGWGAGRYFLPTAGVIVALLASAASSAPSGSARRVAWAALCIALLPATVASLQVPWTSDASWPASAAAIEVARRDGGSVVAPIRPDGWELRLRFEAAPVASEG